MCWCNGDRVFGAKVSDASVNRERNGEKITPGGGGRG